MKILSILAVLNVIYLCPTLLHAQRLKCPECFQSEDLRESSNLPDNIQQKTAEWVINSRAIIMDALLTMPGAKRDYSLFQRDKTDRILRTLHDARNKVTSMALASIKYAEFSKMENELATEAKNQTRQLAAKLQASDRFKHWISLAKLRKHIPTKSLLIEVVKTSAFEAKAIKWPFTKGVRYAAWVIPPAGNGKVSVVDLGPAKTIDAAVADLRELIESHGRQLPAGQFNRTIVENLIVKRLDNLSRLVLQPLHPHLSEFKNLIVCPDGDLWLIPWQALRLKNDYLVMQKNVSYVFTGRQFIVPDKATRPKISKCRIFADVDYKGRMPRLDYSLAEGRAVKRSLEKLPNHIVLLVSGKAATKKAFLDSRGSRVIVTSTHGGHIVHKASRKYFQNLLPLGKSIEDPMNRRVIWLAGANSKMGTLFASEVLVANWFSTDLAVLVAAETAIGTVRDGEGTFSFAYAFQAAGARNVIGTLWSPPDVETAMIDAKMFEHLAKGDDTAVALCKAQRNQIEMLRQNFARGKVAHPLYWAAMSLYGKPLRLRSK